METGEVKYTILVSIEGDVAPYQEQIYDILYNYDGDWDITLETDECFEASGTCRGIFTLYPGVTWGPPEDCYPDEYDEELDWYYEDLAYDLMRVCEDCFVNVSSKE